MTQITIKFTEKRMAFIQAYSTNTKMYVCVAFKVAFGRLEDLEILVIVRETGTQER